MTQAKGKLFIKTFGCQMNVHDSEKLRKILEVDYETATRPEDADLILVNTCSVRERPSQKLFSLLGEYRPLKKARPDLLIGVCGCVAQQEGVKIIKRDRSVDFVLGTQALSRIAEVIARVHQSGQPQVATEWRDSWEDLPLGFAVPGAVTVFAAISRGCNKECSYCIVPQTRGREISRPAAEIERELALAVSQGAREVMLLGQTVNSYGRDLNPAWSFARLVERISLLDGLWRIRFTSPHPQETGLEFIQLFGEGGKVCRHVHLPLQSGSSRVLKRMNRHYTSEEYLSIIAALRERAPDLAVTTDLIVGFPGETDADFEETLQVMRAARFESSFSFMFSPRPNTAAAALEQQIPEEVMLARLHELQRVQQELTAVELQSWIGKEVEVLLDGTSRAEEQCWQGRMSQSIVVNLAKTLEPVKSGDLALVSITASGRNTLRGEFVRLLRPSAAA